MKNLPRNELKQLVYDAQKGDRSAFTCLYRYTFSAQYYRSLSMLKDSHLAEEATQNAYIRAYENLSKLSAPENFLGWMSSITYHCCMDLIRKKDNHEDSSSMENDLLYLLADHMDVRTPLDNILDQEKQSIILDAVNELNESHRNVIKLRYYCDLSIKEIAYVLNCSAGTVKSRLHYSHKELQAKLKARGYSQLGVLLGFGPLASSAFRKYGVGISSPEKKKSHLKYRPAACTGILACMCLSGLMLINRPQITDVFLSDSSKFVNKPPEVTIQVKGPAPDTIYLLYEDGTRETASGISADRYSGYAKKNGILKAELRRNGKIADEKEIKISNLDQIPPELIDYQCYNGLLKVTLYDGQSGVDFNSVIIRKKDGTQILPSDISRDKGSLWFAYDGGELKVEFMDKAGNKESYIILPSQKRYLPS